MDRIPHVHAPLRLVTVCIPLLLGITLHPSWSRLRTREKEEERLCCRIRL